MVPLTGHLRLVFENWGGSCQFSEIFSGLSVLLCPGHSGHLHWRRLLVLPGHLLLGYFRIPEARREFSCFCFRTTVEVNGRERSLACLNSANPSWNSGVVFLRYGMVVFSVLVVVACCSDSWISVGQSLEQLRNGTGLFVVWFPGDCSVAIT